MFSPDDTVSHVKHLILYIFFNPVKPKECFMFLHDTVLSTALFIQMLSEVGPVFTSNKALCHNSNPNISDLFCLTFCVNIF